MDTFNHAGSQSRNIRPEWDKKEENATVPIPPRPPALLLPRLEPFQRNFWNVRDEWKEGPKNR